MVVVPILKVVVVVVVLVRQGLTVIARRVATVAQVFPSTGKVAQLLLVGVAVVVFEAVTLVGLVVLVVAVMALRALMLVQPAPTVLAVVVVEAGIPRPVLLAEMECAL